MKAFRFLILIAIIAQISACSVQINQPNSNTATPKSESANVSNVTPEIKKTEASTPISTPAEKVNNSECYKLIRDDLMVDKKQTFAIDFKPFENSCFVTFHNPEFDNPPLGSQFFIYKNGKEVFEFPEQFGGGNTTCWVTSVSFEDINNDQQKDVIIVGKCGATSSDFNENMVYLNNQKEFTTNAESNAELMDFSKINQIRDFAKKNPKMFVP